MKKVLCFLMLLCMVCTGAWAQTKTIGAPITSTDQLVSGEYVISAMCKNNEGLLIGNDYANITTTTVSQGATITDATWIWTVAKNSDGTFTLAKSNGDKISIQGQSDVGKHNIKWTSAGYAAANMTLNPTTVEINGVKHWMMHQQNQMADATNAADEQKLAYLHCNCDNRGTGDSYLRLSYWEGYNSANNASCVKFAFYKVAETPAPEIGIESGETYLVKHKASNLYLNLKTSGYTETYAVNATSLVNQSDATKFRITQNGSGFDFYAVELHEYLAKQSTTFYWNPSHSTSAEVWLVQQAASAGDFYIKKDESNYLGTGSAMSVGSYVYNDQSTSDNVTWQFEKVQEAPSSQTYTIHILGLPSTNGITVTYGDQALGDGAEVEGTGLTAAAFTNATAVAGYTPTVTVSGTDVNVKYQKNDVSFDSTKEYTSGDIRYQRAITAITLGSETKNIAEADPLSSGTSFKSYRDLTGTVSFTVSPNEVVSIKMNIGSSDNRSWSGGYLYQGQYQNFEFAGTEEPVVSYINGSGVTDFNNSLGSFTTPSAPGTYRMRLVHGSSSIHNVKGDANNFTTDANAFRIVDFLLIVEGKDWDAYNTKLSQLKQYEVGTGLGHYTCTVGDQNISASVLSTYISSFQNGYDSRDADLYDVNIEGIESYIAGMSLNMPETGKFYRLRSVAGNHYLSNNCPNNGNTAITMDGDENTSIFYLDENMGLLAYADGKYVRNPWRTGVKGTTVPGHDDEPYDAAWSFAEGQLGKYVIVYPGGYLLVGNGNNASYANNTEANKKVDNNQWVIEEVTSLPIGMNQNTAGENPDLAFYGSIYLPTTMTVPTGTQAYIATYQPTENLLHMELVGNEGDVIPEGAYILRKADETVSSIIVGAEVNTTTEHTNVLTGTILAGQMFGAGVERYALSGKNGIGFYKYNPDTYPIRKAVYIPAEPSSVAAFYFDFGTGEQTTGIEQMIEQISERNQQNGTIFDLQGRRIQKMQKGMNIINGRKVLR